MYAKVDYFESVECIIEYLHYYASDNVQLKNLSYLTLIPKKDVPKTSIFDKNFNTAAFNSTR